jgi:hypothetical protein
MKVLIILRVALPLVIWVMPIKAEDSPWKQLQSAIEEFFSQSRYAEAQSTFQRALGERGLSEKLRREKNLYLPHVANGQFSRWKYSNHLCSPQHRR